MAFFFLLCFSPTFFFFFCRKLFSGVQWAFVLCLSEEYYMLSSVQIRKSESSSWFQLGAGRIE